VPLRAREPPASDEAVPAPSLQAADFRAAREALPRPRSPCAGCATCGGGAAGCCTAGGGAATLGRAGSGAFAAGCGCSGWARDALPRPRSGCCTAGGGAATLGRAGSGGFAAGCGCSGCPRDALPRPRSPGAGCATCGGSAGCCTAGGGAATVGRAGSGALATGGGAALEGSCGLRSRPFPFPRSPGATAGIACGGGPACTTVTLALGGAPLAASARSSGFPGCCFNASSRRSKEAEAGGGACLAITLRSTTRWSGLACAGGAAPATLALAGAIGAAATTCVARSALRSMRTAARWTGCACTNACAGTAVTAFTLLMLT